MHSLNVTVAMRATLRDQSSVQHHHARDHHKITTHRIAFDAHAKDFRADVKAMSPDRAAEIELSRILPPKSRDEINCPACFMIHKQSHDCA